MYFIDLSKNTSKVITIFSEEKRGSDTYLYEGVFKVFDSCHFYRQRISVFNIDETMIKRGCKHVPLMIIRELVHKSVPGIHVSEEKSICSRDFH